MIYGTYDKDGSVIIQFNPQVEKLIVSPNGSHLLPCDMCGAIHEAADLVVSFVCGPCYEVLDEYRNLGDSSKAAYTKLRQKYPNKTPERIMDYLNGNDGDIPFEQATCSHEWATDGESDRCYCLNCGADGDA